MHELGTNSCLLDGASKGCVLHEAPPEQGASCRRGLAVAGWQSGAEAGWCPAAARGAEQGQHLDVRLWQVHAAQHPCSRAPRARLCRHPTRGLAAEPGRQLGCRRGRGWAAWEGKGKGRARRGGGRGALLATAGSQHRSQLLCPVAGAQGQVGSRWVGRVQCTRVPNRGVCLQKGTRSSSGSSCCPRNGWRVVRGVGGGGFACAAPGGEGRRRTENALRSAAHATSSGCIGCVLRLAPPAGLCLEYILQPVLTMCGTRIAVGVQMWQPLKPHAVLLATEQNGGVTPTS
jgi:hypothetical protein